MDGYEVSGFDDLINDHPNQIKLASNQWQSHNEIRANIIPLSIWNTQWLHQTSRFHVTSFDLPLGITF
jgi:flagellar biosynthesis regulator FlaF